MKYTDTMQPHCRTNGSKMRITFEIAGKITFTSKIENKRSIDKCP